MKIDLLKCQNCRFKAASPNGDEYTGRIHLSNNRLHLLFDNENIETLIYDTEKWEDDNLNKFFAKFDIEVRDPDTYTDWQIGDECYQIDEDDYIGNMIVIFRHGEFVVLKDLDNKVLSFSIEEMKEDRIVLELTEGEKMILEEKDRQRDTMESYKFRKGEPVLVGDDGRVWVIRAYIETENNFYAVTSSGIDKAFYRYCIPYNEKTMHLIGSTEDYEEGK